MEKYYVYIVYMHLGNIYWQWNFIAYKVYKNKNL